MIFRRSENVPRLSRYIDYRDRYLRPDFRFRCAYCLTPEFYFQQGDGGEIDHFRPLNPPSSLGLNFSHLRNEYSNLYWSCSRCNTCKGNAWPTRLENEQGHRFLDPCIEDSDDHWSLKDDGAVEPTTPTGVYTVETIRLNRRRLVWFRKYLNECAQKLRLLEDTLATKDIDAEARLVLIGQLQILKDITDPPVIP